MTKLSRPVLALAVAHLFACATGVRPCSQGGDATWIPEIDKKIRGDQICYQRTFDGVELNDGVFLQKYKSGKTAVEGQFVRGKRHGTWVQYDEKGNRILEKYYEMGVEKAPPGR
ncbi:MAG: toxin-antitoxin system YwqK family antitoxin [Bacteriovoracia bacterium]